MFIYHIDNTVTIKCNDGLFRTYVLTKEQLLEYIETGEFDYKNNIEVDSSNI